MAKIKPAPWHLKGYGFAIGYQLNRSFVVKHTPAFLKGKFDGGMGYIVMANYEEADCGPYSEILFIPGKFEHQKEKYRSIQKIYVSSKEAKDGGIENWGIPKEVADFHWQTLPSGMEELSVTKNNEEIIRVKFKMRNLSFPVNARWIKTPLIQKKAKDLVQIRLRGFGRARRAQVVAMDIAPNEFPDISTFSPVVACKIDSFSIKFPRAKRIKVTIEAEEDRLKREMNEQKKAEKKEAKLEKKKIKKLKKRKT